MMIFVVGILAMVATGGTVMRQVGAARQETLAATLGQSRLEQLRGLGCSSSGLVNGTSSTRGVTEKWSVSTPGGANTAVTFRLLVDSVSYVAYRSTKWHVLTSLRPCP
jgi:hypothetical protein